MYAVIMGLVLAAVFECVLAGIRWLRRRSDDFRDQYDAEIQLFDDPLHRLITSNYEPEIYTGPLFTTRIPPSPFLDICLKPAPGFVRGFDPDAFMATIIPLFPEAA